MKKLMLVLLVLLTTSTAKADLITYNDIWGGGTDAHEVITNTRLNGWNTAFKNTINGLLDYVNIKPLGIQNSNIANNTIQAGKMECSSYWATLTGCGGVVNADARHIHSAAAITFATGTGFASSSDSVQDAIDAIATYVGYSSSSASFSTTTYQMVFSGVAIDDVSTWSGVASTPSISMSVATGTATGGVLVDISAYIVANTPAGGVPNANIIDVPLCINGVALSESSAQNPRYVLKLGSHEATVLGSMSKKIAYRVADGWNPNIINTISICSPYLADSHGSGTLLVQNYSLSLYILR